MSLTCRIHSNVYNGPRAGGQVVGGGGGKHTSNETIPEALFSPLCPGALAHYLKRTMCINQTTKHLYRQPLSAWWEDRVTLKFCEGHVLKTMGLLSWWAPSAVPCMSVIGQHARRPCGEHTKACLLLALSLLPRYPRLQDETRRSWRKCYGLKGWLTRLLAWQRTQPHAHALMHLITPRARAHTLKCARTHIAANNCFVNRIEICLIFYCYFSSIEHGLMWNPFWINVAAFDLAVTSHLNDGALVRK